MKQTDMEDTEINNATKSIRINIPNNRAFNLEVVNNTLKGFEAFAQKQNDFVQNINTITQSLSSLGEVTRRYYENSTRLLEAVDSFNKNVSAFLECDLDYSKIV